MRKLLISLLVLSVLMPINVIHSQDEYKLKEIKEQLNKADLKQIEKAEKYLASANDQMNAAQEIGDVGKNKNKAFNKKISAATDFGSAHKIIYNVYLENVQKLSAVASGENSGKSKKNIDEASKLFKEAKKKRESSLKVDVLEKAYELLEQAVDLEKKAITGLSETYALLTNTGKKVSNEKVVKTETNQTNNKVGKKEVDEVKKEPVDDKIVGKNEVTKTDNSKINDNEKKDEIVKNNVVDETNQIKEQEIKGVYFKIQIAASKTTLSVEQLNAIYKTNEVFSVDKDGEWYKYYVGQRFKIYDEALAYKNNLKIKGIFIIAYKDGKRVSMEEALKKDDEKKEIVEIKKDVPLEIKKNQEVQTVYRLQIGISTKPLSQKEISEFKSAGKPVLSIDHGGWFSYNIGDFNTEKEAQNFKKIKGLSDAVVVKFANGILIEE